MRIGIAGLWHETNTYATRRATLDEFAAFELDRGEAIVARNAGTSSVIGGILAGLDGCEVVPLLAAGAWPCGPAPRETIERLLADLDAALSAAGPLDGVVMNLHGAMVAEGIEDPELAAVRLVRERIGDRPVTAVLDPHGNPSPELVAACDALVAYDTYPHVDMGDRGAEAASLLRAALDGRPLTAVVAKVPMLTCPLAQASDAEPMRSLLAQARAEQAADPRVARVSLLFGFPYSDVPRAGYSVVVTVDRHAEARGAELAAELAAAASARATAFALSRPGAAEAVRQALAGEPPVVLADVADNVGGGAPGDGTVLLAELLAQGATDAVVQIADADAAVRAVELGAGAVFDGAVGGKADNRHGAPVAVRGRIERAGDARYTSSSTWMTGRAFAPGAAAVVRVDGVTVVLTERPVPPFGGELLASLGVDPAAARIIVAKGAVAWRAAFGDLARTVIEVDTPGICPIDLASLERHTVPAGFDPVAG